MKSYFRAIHQIITTGHWITDQVSLELKEFDITEPQYNVLKSLQEANGVPLTVQQILDNMVQRSSNITRIVDKLIAKGLVQRKECSSNRRKMDITIKEEGLNLIKKLDAKVIAFHEPLTKNLTEEELILLKDLIIKLRNKTND